MAERVPSGSKPISNMFVFPIQQEKLRIAGVPVAQLGCSDKVFKWGLFEKNIYGSQDLLFSFFSKVLQDAIIFVVHEILLLKLAIIQS